MRSSLQYSESSGILAGSRPSFIIYSATKQSTESKKIVRLDIFKKEYTNARRNDRDMIQ